MGRFIGREEELAFLKQNYEAPVFKAVALIGRRRVGKTCLIEEFIKDKDHFYIQFLDSSPRVNLRYIETCMEHQFGEQFRFRDSIDFFSVLTELIRGKKYVIVFDEYPFMSSKDDAFSSLLQNLIDHDIGESMIILSGSSVGMMDQEISDHSRPLFGRVHRYVLEPMKISDCMRFHPGMSDEDQMCMYLTFGGIPMYYDSPMTDSYREYLTRYVLGKNAALNLEGESIIRREFTPSDEYSSLLDAISDRSNTVADMVNVTGLDRSTVKHHLDRMIDMGLIERIHMMAGSKTRPERYRIKDRMLAFHHHVLRMSQMSYSSSGYDYDAIKDRISTFHGRMFELQCADYIKDHYPVKEIGVWYGNVPLKDKDGRMRKDASGKVLTEPTDIDLVAYVQYKGAMLELYGECRFTAEPVGFGEMRELTMRMSNAHVGANNKMIFFSRSGFYSDFTDYAKEEGILLVDIRDMLC